MTTTPDLEPSDESQVSYERPLTLDEVAEALATAGVTITELRSSCEEQAARIADLVTERDAWRTAKMRDPEAECISACVTALRALTGEGSPSMSNSRRPGGAERVLRHLALRFGVEWPTAQIPDVLLMVAAEDVRAHEQVEAVTREGFVRRGQSLFR